MSKKLEQAKSKIQSDTPNGRPIEAGADRQMPPSSKYEEMQLDEIQVLRSIFMDDYEDIESKKPWSKATEKQFKIRLSAFSDKEVWISLLATLTATYPKTVPLLHLGESSNVRPQTLQNIQKILTSKPKELLGEVMIHEIASIIQEELEDAASAQVKGDQLPSLEQERAFHEASAFELARSQEQAMQKREQEEQEKAGRKMQLMLDEQMKKRTESRLNKVEKTTELQPKVDSPFVTVTFDQSITSADDMAQEVTFRSVSLVTLFRKGPVTENHMVVPLTQDKAPQSMILKRVVLKSCRSKLSILELEKSLERLKQFRHPNAINVLGFKVSNELETWHFDILTEFGNQGCLLDMLSVVDVLPAQKARLFSIELLAALRFLHDKGIIHGRIHAGNVIFHRHFSGNVTLKLADSGFQDTLHILRNDAEATPPKDIRTHTRWRAPELDESVRVTKSKKSDIWDFGVVLVEILLGLAVTEKFSTAANFMNSNDLSEPFENLIRDVFKPDPRKRPNAFDIAPYEFFRADIPALLVESDLTSRSSSVAGVPASTIPRRLRHESSAGYMAGPKSVSRYASEWDEAGRLGKGGFGEVVKARNKLDGRIYAIKKITQKTPAELSQVLSEVYLLATLNHPYVVRYYTAWPEDDAPTMDEVSEDTTSSVATGFLGPSTTPRSADFGHSTRGLDFISSSGYPKIEFGYDEDEEALSDEQDESGSSEDSNAVKHPERGSSSANDLFLQRTRSVSRPAIKSTLFIQMEFCERHTLRDIIRKGVQDDMDETWRLFRQILEAIQHIHSHGIIHRDLKPENIFIDSANNTKIGDFGLAKSGQFNLLEPDGPNKFGDGEMTQNVGTTFYVAPELQTNTKGSFSDKIDMYSLGVIFFELCHPLKTAMERGEVLSALRKKDYVLPPDFNSSEKAVQGEIIEWLLKHRPSERPSSAELLRSGRVPLQIEDETIKIALEGLADDSSPYYHRMMSALFSKNPGHQIKAQVWDMSSKDALQTRNVEYGLLQSMVHERLVTCFRRHGAIESYRQGLIPQSGYYQNRNVVQLLDASGTLVQLPYDFTLPHARIIAKQSYESGKSFASFAIGSVFRDSLTGGAPRSSREADFDIVTCDAKEDLALKEAEVIKVVDELLDEFPPLASVSMCFHISHSGLLDHIMDFCRVTESQKAAAKEILGRLNIQDWTWQKIRLELRSASLGISSTSLDELAQFDFRDTPEKSLIRLQAIFAGTDYLPRLHVVFTHISGLVEYCKRWGVKRKIYFSPLSSFNDKFYRDGVMFQCLFDAKKRDVVAAGGRYDKLVEEHRPRITGSVTRQTLHACGVNIAWDRIVTSMARYQKQSNAGRAFLKKGEESEPPTAWLTRRCDCLVASFDSTVLRSTGIRIVSLLWATDISAELAIDARTPEELLTHYREDKHSWIITIKHDAAVSAKADLKVKCMDKKEDFDVRSSELLTFIRGEIRDREQREGANERLRLSRLYHGDSSSNSNSGITTKAPVHVLTAAHKSKKSNKYRVIEAAQAASQELCHGFASGPIASIETRDEVLDIIKETRLSDTESWRRVVQKVPLNERQYIQEVQELLASFKATCLEEGGTAAAFVFNFRTGKCVFYDLMA